MHNCSRSAAAAAALLSSLVMMPAVWAQDATGKIAGNVKDATGGVIPAAVVIVTNLDTKTSKRTVTDKQGSYQVLQLPIGNYEVSAEATGFSKSIARPASALEINQTLRVDLTLEVGATNTQILSLIHISKSNAATPPHMVCGKYFRPVKLFSVLYVKADLEAISVKCGRRASGCARPTEAHNA